MSVDLMTGGRLSIHNENVKEPEVRPFLKWAGGKQWLAPAAKKLLPNGFEGRYYEPFLGGGAFFFALAPSRATLSDSNGELITAYEALRDDPQGVIKLLRKYPHHVRFFYRMRKKRTRSPTGTAARMIYLNRTCWNGLYRVNRQGRFNTPMGRLVNPTICDSDRLLAAAKRLKRSQLRLGDFESIVDGADVGDLVYFDPPYITGHKNNSFLKYNAQLFSWSDQERLALCARRLAQAGVNVMVTNADDYHVVSLYKDFYYHRLVRRSLVGGPVSSRKTVRESLLTNYPIMGFESETL